MFDILVVIAFLVLVVKFLGLAFKIAWGLAKVTAFVLFLLALPALVVCVLFVGGLALLLPLALVLAAIGLLGLSH